jgi:hypothetical protein
LADVGCGADGGDGRFVDDFGAVFCGHVYNCMVWCGMVCMVVLVWFGLESEGVEERRRLWWMNWGSSCRIRLCLSRELPTATPSLKRPVMSALS